MNPRLRNTDVDGKLYTNEMAAAVWDKAEEVPGKDPVTWRLDVCGHLIHFFDYANINSSFGWEIDHILPVSAGGGEDLGNLQPLFWNTNRLKGDDHPWKCSDVPDAAGK